jgi:hypothetical protein
MSELNFKTIITSFAQHGFGNCTSIGVIKAAIEAFGLNNVFTVSETASGSKIDLRNGRSVEISKDELAYSEKNCGFKLLNDADALKKSIRDYAVLSFAVICKSKQIIEEYEKYEDAVDDVNTGENYHEAPMYLGLEKYQVNIRYKDVDKYGGIVAHSVKHTVYVSHDYFDDYGMPNRLNSIGEWAKFSRRIYRFKHD